MPGFGYDYCAKIPEIVALGAFGDATGKFCTAVTNAPTYSTRPCGGTQTPVLYNAGISFNTIDLPDQFTYEIEFWTGVEETEFGKCVWFGVEGGELFGSYCTKSPQCYKKEITYEVLIPLIQDTIDNIIYEIEDGSALETVLTVAAIVLAIVLLAAAGYVIGMCLPRRYVFTPT